MLLTVKQTDAPPNINTLTAVGLDMAT